MNKKNIVTATRTIALVFAAVFTFSLIISCGDDKDDHTHEWEWQVTTPATATADGLETETCKICGATNGTRPIAMLHTHTYSTTWSKDATQHWRECTANDGAKTDVANHDWEWVETTAPTLTENGLETETCKTCGATSGNTRPIAKLPTPCPCADKVHYDTPCDCVGVGNDCDCTVIYQPALAEVFAYRVTVTEEVQEKVVAAYNAIWASNPQLLLRLPGAVAKKDSVIDIAFGTSNFEVVFNQTNGRILISSPNITSVGITEFTAAFEAAIVAACDNYLD